MNTQTGLREDTLELLIAIGHLARVYRYFDEARYLFERLATVYPQRAFPYLGLGLIEVDRANYRGAARLFGHALELVPDNAQACAWLGASQVLEGHFALGVRTLLNVIGSDEPSAAAMAEAFLKLPECAPFTRGVRIHRAAQSAPVPSFSTLNRLNFRGRH
ncbi:hypothetical protein LFL96_06145 [Paraburkholderia sp. D15]|uniref:tetratricopeptide repeat protein n=1 Tax=Paraburkholderia sp. D15 TaxID=2880218 RepID=UPI002479E9F5|nr:hypothetical protein [Paraburkholderia sp. D15]WGS51081.1 hypothetical protein LFL96_06145 [Paraburkholderia sp. D15]WKF59064.1 hypothetical protein HUO10_003572 [Paraburkholderia busanensis]